MQSSKERRRTGAADAASENRKKTKRNLKTHLLRFLLLIDLLPYFAYISSILLFSFHEKARKKNELLSVFFALMIVSFFTHFTLSYG